MDILGKMKQPHFFSNSEQAIITYIMEHSEAFKKATVKELAHISYTSSSTVIRLYQKLGYQNYSDFKLDFFSALESQSIAHIPIDANFPFTKDDGFSTIVKNMGILSVNAIDETLSLIDETLYQNVIKLLDNADFIDIYGVGTNQNLAFDFKMNMLRINKLVNIPYDHQQLVINAASSNPKHVSLIISYTGETHETIEYCRYLKTTGSPMICITNMGNNTISDLCDISLKIVSREKMFSKIGTFSSKVSIMMILDILYSGVFILNYDENLDMIIKKRKATTSFRSTFPSLSES